jgi:COP9 signalosome complex subunit 5
MADKKQQEAKKDVSDNLYKYDEDADNKIRKAAPWQNDPEYFKRCKISSVALLKIILHARKTCTEEYQKGNEPVEVMGLMQGKLEDRTFVVVDAFGLCEGNEVSVQPKDEDYEYIIDYTDTLREKGLRKEKLIGWYHSHPGLGVFLSGTDVATQRFQQTHLDPYLSIVIDPMATVSSGKPRMGAFRVFPEGYKPKEPVNWVAAQTIYGVDNPGAYKDQFYPLEIEIFKSSLDSVLFDHLYQQFWGKALSTSKNLATRDFITAKITVAATSLEKLGKDVGQSQGHFALVAKRKKKDEDTELDEVCNDISRVSIDQLNGSFTQLVKNSLFTVNQ